MDQAKQKIVDGLLQSVLDQIKTDAVVIEHVQIGTLTDDEKKEIGEYLYQKVKAEGFEDDPLVGHGSTGRLGLGLKKF